MSIEKKCTKCGETKETSMFYRKKATKDGFRPECKNCTNFVNRKYRIENADFVKEVQAKYREENRESLREKSAEYRENNREECIRRTLDWQERNRNKYKRTRRAYYDEHKEEIARKNAEWANKNPWSRVQRQQRRRALKLSLPSDFSPENWRQCLSFFNYACAYCGLKEEVLHQDHVIPVSKGGPYTPSNIVPACRKCNLSKHASDLAVWYVSTDYFCEERYEKIKWYLSDQFGGAA